MVAALRLMRQSAPWLLGWLGLVIAGSVLAVRVDIANRRAAFETDARIAHRLLSQRAVQHEAILVTLTLLSPSASADADPERRLPALYPQLIEVVRRSGAERWNVDAMRVAEERSRQSRRPEIASLDTRMSRFTLVLAGDPTSFALVIGMPSAVPWDEWPFDRAGPVSASLVYAGERFVIQAGQRSEERPAGLTAGFRFAKTLTAASQPFELRVARATGPAQWPWAVLSSWAASCALALWAWASWLRAKRGRRRAEELLRASRVARLNVMGELAAGVAHEMNQPLAAVLANVQAARRLLEEVPPQVATARNAISQASGQARRAADVVARLRRLVETQGSERAAKLVSLRPVLRGLLELLEPEILRRGVRVAIEGQAPAVLADPVALEQIVHNLIENAMHALGAVPPAERVITLRLGVEGACALLDVCDTGPGIPPDALARLFEPFYTTREGGLGLGLSLCETLAHSIGAAMEADNVEPRGARFRLRLRIEGEPA